MIIFIVGHCALHVMLVQRKIISNRNSRFSTGIANTCAVKHTMNTKTANDARAAFCLFRLKLMRLVGKHHIAILAIYKMTSICRLIPILGMNVARYKSSSTAIGTFALAIDILVCTIGLHKSTDRAHATRSIEGMLSDTRHCIAFFTFIPMPGFIAAVDTVIPVVVITSLQASHWTNQTITITANLLMLASITTHDTLSISIFIKEMGSCQHFTAEITNIPMLVCIILVFCRTAAMLQKDSDSTALLTSVAAARAPVGSFFCRQITVIAAPIVNILVIRICVLPVMLRAFAKARCTTICTDTRAMKCAMNIKATLNTLAAHIVLRR